MLRTARLLLGTAPHLSDEADALAIAVCHLARRAGRLAVPALRNVAVAVPAATGRARPALTPARARAALAAARLRPARRDHRGLA
jgi:crossover junction endodeoxyribonuclease RuvC